MSIRFLVTSVALLAMSACSAPTGAASATVAASPTLAAYRSDDELQQALERWRSATASRRAVRAEVHKEVTSATKMAAADAATGSAESITNVQTAGVDEGGIVKRAGDYLIVLRRGRLFTVRVGGDALQPVATLDAYAPHADPRGAWYDELLVAGRTVVVVGYSYARGGTEIGLFELDERGGLAYRATYHLRSFDYYSARNYASRLIGRQLIFYSPTLLQPWGTPPMQMLPGLRRWRGPSAPADWQRILPATRVYRSDDDFDPDQPLALHNVTRCELGQAEMRCESTAVLGPAGRVFYVSQGSVYVWTATRTGPVGGGREEATSVAFRIPLDGSAPTGLKTVGVPLDQLSFLEDASGHLNVLLRASGAGEGMWGHLRAQGGTALLRVPLTAFGDGRGAAQREHYRVLPGARWTQNRFVGDWLLWGGAQVTPRQERSGDAATAWAVRYAAEAPPVPLDPGHDVERIEALGGHAVLVGNAGADLHFSAVRLDPRGDRAELAGRHVLPAARQGETRTHGFFYRPDGPASGLLGLPVVGAAQRTSGVARGGQGSAAVTFLRERDLRFTPLGDLAAQSATVNDDCRASCVDWYGNARPLFLGERIVALLGYELVEGRLERGWSGEQVVERRRANFAPRLMPDGGRASPFSP